MNDKYYFNYWIPVFALWLLLCICLHHGYKINQDIKKITSTKKTISA